MMKIANLHLKLEHLVLSAIVLLGAGLRFWQLGRNSLWVDEIGQVLVAGGGPAAAVTGAGSHFGAAPLDYVITSLTLQLGSSEWLLRLPAAIWGTVSIVLIYWLCRLLWQSTATGLLAAFLLALMPAAVEFSQEVRWYSLSMMLALLGGCLYLWALRSKRTAAWVLLGAVFLLAVMTALFQVFVIAALSMAHFVFWVWGRFRAQPAPHAGPAAAHLQVGTRDLLYFAITLLAPAAFAIYWAVSGALRHDAAGAFVFMPIPYPELTAYPLFGAYGEYLHPWPLYRELAGPVVFPLLAVIGLVAGLVRRQGATLVPALVVLVAGAGIFAVDYASSYFWSYRQFLLIVPYYLCLAAYGLWSLVLLVARKPQQQALAVALLLPPLLWLIVPQLQLYYGYSKTNWRATAAILAAAAGDPANHIAIDPMWQPYVFYYDPALRARVVDLTTIAIAEGPELPMRIWYLGARDPLAGGVPSTWEVETITAEPTLPIYVASNMPAAEWLPDFAQASAPPAAYLYGLLYRLAWIDWDQMLQAGERLVQAIRDGSAGLSSSQSAELLAMIGRIRFDAGETAPGLALMHEAVSHNDLNQEALNHLGYALIQTGDQRQAAAVLQQNTWHHPRSYWAYSFLANLHEYREEWRQAAEYHVKAWEFAYDPTMKAEQAAAADAAYQKTGDETARQEFAQRVQAESEQ